MKDCLFVMFTLHLMDSAKYKIIFLSHSLFLLYTLHVKELTQEKEKKREEVDELMMNEKAIKSVVEVVKMEIR